MEKKIINLLISLIFLISCITINGGNVQAVEYDTKIIEQKVSKNKSWTLTFNQPIKSSSINDQTIFVENSLRFPQRITYEQISDKKIKISAPDTGYLPGETYKLYAMNLYSQKNKKLKTNKIIEFTTQPEEIQYEVVTDSPFTYANGSISLDVTGNRTFKNVNFTSEIGEIKKDNNKFSWTAPENLGTYTINLSAKTEFNETINHSFTVEVIEPQLNGVDEDIFSDDPNDRTTDTDKDGLTDYEELYVYFTNPILDDSDYDGISDGVEIQNGTDPTIANASVRATNSLETIDTSVTNKFDIQRDSIAFANPSFTGYFAYGGGMCMGMAFVSALNAVDILPTNTLMQDYDVNLFNTYQSKLSQNYTITRNNSLYNMAALNNVDLVDSSSINDRSFSAEKQRTELRKAISYWWAKGNNMQNNSPYFIKRSQVNERTINRKENVLLNSDIQYLIETFNAGLPTVITSGERKTRSRNYTGHAVLAYGMKKISDSEYKLFVYDNNYPYEENKSAYAVDTDNSDIYISLKRKSGTNNWTYAWENPSATYASDSSLYLSTFNIFKMKEYISDTKNTTSLTKDFSLRSNNLKFNVENYFSDAQLEQITVLDSDYNDVVITERQKIENNSNPHISLNLQNASNPLIHVSLPVYIKSDGLASHYDASVSIENSTPLLFNGNWRLITDNTSYKRYGYDSNILSLTQNSNGNITGTSYISLNNERYNLPITGEYLTDGKLLLKEAWNNSELFKGIGDNQTPDSVVDELISKELSNKILLDDPIAQPTNTNFYPGTLQNITWNWIPSLNILSSYGLSTPDSIQLIKEPTVIVQFQNY